MDAFGLATLDSVASSLTARVPFSGSPSFSLMTDEDSANLRTLQRLVSLLSGLQEDRKTGLVRDFHFNSLTSRKSNHYSSVK